MFVVYFNDEENKKYEYQLVNPKIIMTSLKCAALQGGEGCLSVETKHDGLVHRHYQITIKGYDALTNKDVILSLKGYPSIVFQHEYDHLDGILFYDRIDKANPNAKKDNETLL